MSHQTMNGNRSEESPASGMGRNLSGLIYDLTSLVELQCRLTACDVRETASQSWLPMLIILMAALLALSALPVLLIGLGWWLTQLSGIPLPAAFLLVSVVALGVAAIAAWWGSQRLRQAFAVLQRSRDELASTLNWIKRAASQHAARQDNCRDVAWKRRSS